MEASSSKAEYWCFLAHVCVCVQEYVCACVRVGWCIEAMLQVRQCLSSSSVNLKTRNNFPAILHISRSKNEAVGDQCTFVNWLSRIFKDWVSFEIPSSGPFLLFFSSMSASWAALLMPLILFPANPNPILFLHIQSPPWSILASGSVCPVTPNDPDLLCVAEGTLILPLPPFSPPVNSRCHLPLRCFFLLSPQHLHTPYSDQLWPFFCLINLF